MTTKEKLQQFWDSQDSDVQNTLKEMANTPEGHKLMYVVLEAELAKRGEELSEEKINKYTDMAIGFILAQ